MKKNHKKWLLMTTPILLIGGLSTLALTSCKDGKKSNPKPDKPSTIEEYKLSLSSVETGFNEAKLIFDNNDSFKSLDNFKVILKNTQNTNEVIEASNLSATIENQKLVLKLNNLQDGQTYKIDKILYQTNKEVILSNNQVFTTKTKPKIEYEVQEKILKLDDKTYYVVLKVKDPQNLNEPTKEILKSVTFTSKISNVANLKNAILENQRPYVKEDYSEIQIKLPRVPVISEKIEITANNSLFKSFTITVGEKHIENVEKIIDITKKVFGNQELKSISITKQNSSSANITLSLKLNGNSIIAGANKLINKKDKAIKFSFFVKNKATNTIKEFNFNEKSKPIGSYQFTLNGLDANSDFVIEDIRYDDKSIKITEELLASLSFSTK
ncbi:putative lipoprotein [Ureaplasma urealyticum serovar 2 str. ATCC 27814]|uniref:hypothetical protein n=1 Tax=Ureaplasma urealyticum TaxID=2130 RepID=UPI0001794119|nr:hypothetical protein [Ureaplasma urealyticum]EEH02416.1 putative lipoprotein [Ureaplasma urealyticum serovar 2 str. ATCC 27814]UNT66422.1 hypothetical protein IF687_01050 [Ureaplasma urealyticum]